jgi:hypothetical protein
MANMIDQTDGGLPLLNVLRTLHSGGHANLVNVD